MGSYEYIAQIPESAKEVQMLDSNQFTSNNLF